MRYVRTTELRTDMVLAVPLIDSRNRILLTAGKQLSDHVIRRLHVMGVEGVYIDDELSKDIIITSAIGPELQRKVIQQLRKKNIDHIVDSARNIVDEIMENSDYLNNMLLVKDFDDYTYQHSMNVGILSSVLGVAVGFSKEDMVNLTAAALLHDIGKIESPLEVLNKKGKLTEKEMEFMKHHPTSGYKILRQNENILSVVRVAVYEHHENVDGTGYPRGIEGSKIHRFAKIIHIADVYDAMISKRPYKAPIHPEDAMAFIMSNSGSMFDPFFADFFLRCVPVYPKGATVYLSNGEKAIVTKNYPEHALRPDIRLFNGKNVSLMKHIEYRNVVIEKTPV